MAAQKQSQGEELSLSDTPEDEMQLVETPSLDHLNFMTPLRGI